MPQSHSPDPSCSLCTACSWPLGGHNSECGNQVLAWERSNVPGQGSCSDSEPSDKRGSAVTSRSSHWDGVCAVWGLAGRRRRLPAPVEGPAQSDEEEHGCIFLPVAVHSEADLPRMFFSQKVLLPVWGTQQLSTVLWKWRELTFSRARVLMPPCHQGATPVTPRWLSTLGEG